MSKDKVPVGKIARASRYLRTGLKVGANYAGHYAKKAVGSSATRDDLDTANATDILDGFTELRGSALKVAQMLSMDSINFSESFTNVMQKAQYSVPPMSAPLALQAFKSSTGKSPSDYFDQFNPNAVAAASMGQVHEAYKDGKRFAVKIQYPGVGDSIKSDLKLVKGMAARVMHVKKAELQPYFEEVEERLLEEADYTCELQNSMEFAEKCQNAEGIIFPTYYPEMSSKRVLVMEWLDGVHLKDFMAQKPDNETRRHFATNIWNFYEYQMHQLRKVNADPHPGNFLFREDGKVGVLDFGCTKVLHEGIYEPYFTLPQPGLFKDEARAKEVLLNLDILRETDSDELRDKLLDIFSRLIGVISRPYHQGWFDFSSDEHYQRISEIAEEISELRELRGSRDFIFINKSYYGLFGLFNSMKVKLKTTCQYKDFLNEELVQENPMPEELKQPAVPNLAGLNLTRNIKGTV